MEQIDFLLTFTGSLVGAFITLATSYFGFIRQIRERLHHIELRLQELSYESELKSQQSGHKTELEIQVLKFQISNLSEEDKRYKKELEALKFSFDLIFNEK
ncbi:hypothetical protein [Methanolapillus millepedarum]